MPINTKELLDGLSILLDEENMKVTIKETGKGTLVCATACFIGGIVAGPFGLAVGGTLGGLGAAMLTKDKFKPVSEVIKNDLTTVQRETLVEKIMLAVQEFHPTDVAAILALVANNHAIQDVVLKTVAGYLTNEMKLKILD
ncbi:protein C19orf12 homolog [Condylostylus longicornis]|uniref:protein C19orf12 homolog n=1 Tax=Condylostylus longicornis TaxID=2530218 RepID=UPI00244DFF4F|nr:protein C19orf12 homolog [Condylostylus longicornis]